MGCPITKDKLECNMLALKLKRIEIRLAKDKEMAKYKKNTGEDLERDPIPDYIVYNGIVKFKDCNNEKNNKNEQTCSTIKRDYYRQGTPSTIRSKNKSHSNHKFKKIHKNASSETMLPNLNPMPIKLKSNGTDSFFNDKQNKLRKNKTGRSSITLKGGNSEGGYERKKTANLIRLNNKYTPTNRDFYPVNSLLLNGLKINDNNQYLNGLRVKKIEPKKKEEEDILSISEFKSRRKKVEYEGLYNNDNNKGYEISKSDRNIFTTRVVIEKKKMEQFKMKELNKEISSSEKSFYQTVSEDEEEQNQYERRFTNKLSKYLMNTVKQNLNEDK